MTEFDLERLWCDIPIGSENAIGYNAIMQLWGKDARKVRHLLQNLSAYDNGDNYILIRSSHNHGGFYRTDKAQDIERYRRECLNKGRSLFAPLKKINRVIRTDAMLFTVDNNLRAVREEKKLTQAEVCRRMRKIDANFDAPLLSRMENGYCIPTPFQLVALAEIYETSTNMLCDIDFCV